MSSLLSCLSDFSNAASLPSSVGGHILDLSSLELSELSAADLALLHQFLRNGATFDAAQGSGAQHNGGSANGDSHSNVPSGGGGTASSTALERVILPSFTSAGRGASILYAFVQLLDVLDVATKCETLYRLRAIENFHSFSNYFLMDRLWTPTVLESLVDKCGKISKRLQRRQAATYTFGVHGGGNIGLGLIAHLVTKPRRGLLRAMSTTTMKEAASASTATPHANSEAVASGVAGGPAALSSTSSASPSMMRRGPTSSSSYSAGPGAAQGLGQNYPDSLPVDLLSMSGALASTVGSAHQSNNGAVGVDSQSKSATSGSDLDSDSSGTDRDCGEATWRVVATTSKLFHRLLIRAGGRIRLRHQIAAVPGTTRGRSQYGYTEIPNVSLVDRSLSSVRELYVKSSVLALCVTLSVFQQIRHDIAVGLMARFLHDEMPLTVLVCINGTNAEQAVRDGVFAELAALTGDAFARRVLHGINFVECVVDRIVRQVDDDEITAQIIAQVTEKFASATERESAGGLTSSASGDLHPDSPTAGRSSTADVGANPASGSQSLSSDGDQSGLQLTTQNTGEALFELCAAAASKERVKAMMNSATECQRFAKLLVMYGIRVALFDAERVCSVYSRPFPEAHLLPHFSLTDDVRLYESVKNKFVNGTHYILSAMAGLSGYDLIAQAIRSPFLRGFVVELMEQEIAPVLIRAFPSFAPPNPILDRLKREFVLRCEENAADTVARVARDPMRKMSRGRRIRGTLELRDKYKLSTPCYRLELGYCAALLYALQCKDTDSGEKLRQVFQSAAAANCSYRAALTYSGPSAAGPFVGFHPDREADRVQRLLAMIVVLKQLASREKMAQLGLQLDLTTGHIFYQRKPAIPAAACATTGVAAAATPTVAAPTIPPLSSLKADRSRSMSTGGSGNGSCTPTLHSITSPPQGSDGGIAPESDWQRQGQTHSSAPAPAAGQRHSQSPPQAQEQGQPLVTTTANEAQLPLQSRASDAYVSAKQTGTMPTGAFSQLANSSASASASASTSQRDLVRIGSGAITAVSSGTDDLSASQTDVALLQQVQLQMRLQQLAAGSTAPSSGPSVWSAVSSSSSLASNVSSSARGSQSQLQSQSQSSSGKLSGRVLSVGSNLDSLDFGGSEQSDDRDDIADTLPLISSESPSHRTTSAAESESVGRYDGISPQPSGLFSGLHLSPIQPIEPRSPWLQRRITYELLFIRHGETFGNCGQSTRDGRIDRAAVEANVKDRSRRIFQGDVDTEINQLTAQGQNGAQHAADQIIAEFVQQRKWIPEVLLHSPLTRAADTAKPLLSLLPALTGSAMADEALREMKFGLAENARICDLLEAVPQGVGGPGTTQTFSSISGAADADAESHTWRRTCHTFYLDQNASYRFPEGESFCDVLWRVHSFLMRLESRFPGKRIVVYGHSMWGAACAIIFGRGVTPTKAEPCESPLHAQFQAQQQQQQQQQQQEQTLSPNQASTPAPAPAPAPGDYLAFDGPHVLPHTTPIPMNF